MFIVKNIFKWRAKLLSGNSTNFCGRPSSYFDALPVLMSG